MIVTLTCPFCNFSKKVSKEKIPVNARKAICPRCRQQFEFSIEGQGFGGATKEGWAETGQEEKGAKSEKTFQRPGAPWENRSELGLWQGIYQTFKAVLVSPQAFFSTKNYQRGFREPLAFGLLIGSVGSMFGFFWQFLVASGGLLSLADSIFSQFAMGMIFLAILVIAPISVIAGMLFSSAIWHLLLLIVRGGKNGFEATFRVVAYSYSTQVLAVIPFVGGLIAVIWQIVVQIIGLREIHETSYLRVIIAFLIPVACIFFLAIIGVLIVALIFFRQHA